MPDKTHELPTHKISQPLDISEPIQEATGAWSIEDSDEPLEQSFEIIEHRLEDSSRRRLGRAAYWLTHRKYRREVRDRANHIVKDVADKGSTEKQVLPPRTRDYSDIPERRKNNADFALDILEYIKNVRRVRRVMGLLAFMTADKVHVPKQLPLPTIGLPDSLVPVTAVEEQLPPLDGDAHSDGDFITKIIVESDE